MPYAIINGRIVEVDPSGNPIQSGPPTMAGNVGPISLPDVAPEDASQIMDVTKRGLGAGLDVASIGLGLPIGRGTIGPAARILGQGGIGALKGLMGQGGLVSKGPIGNAIEGMILQGSQHAAEGASRLGNKLAYRIGGLDPQDARKATESLGIINEDYSPLLHRRIPVGNSDKLEAQLKNIHARGEAARAADPSMRTFGQSIRGGVGDLYDASGYDALPITRQRQVHDQLAQIVTEQNAKRGTTLQLGGSQVPARQGQVGRAVGSRRVRVGDPLDVPTRYKIEQNLKHSPEVENLAKARIKGEKISSSEKVTGQLWEGLGNAMRDQRYADEAARLGLQPGVQGPQQLSDFLYHHGKVAEEAFDALHSPNILADPGKMAARGGLGAGTARAIGGGIGLAAGLGAGGGGLSAGTAALGGILGPLVLSPRGISTGANFAASGMEFGPHMLRTLNLGKDLTSSHPDRSTLEAMLKALLERNEGQR